MELSEMMAPENRKRPGQHCTGQDYKLESSGPLPTPSTVSTHFFFLSKYGEESSLLGQFYKSADIASVGFRSVNNQERLKQNPR